MFLVLKIDDFHIPNVSVECLKVCKSRKEVIDFSNSIWITKQYKNDYFVVKADSLENFVKKSEE